jgi:ABC-type glycerol-3-phosphate transport system permease component
MVNAFTVFLLRQFFAQIPGELFDAALIDGCGHLRFLTQIVLPISKAPLMTVIILNGIWAWNSLQWPLIVTSTPDWRPITVGLTGFISEAGAETQLIMAGSVITTIPILVLYFFTQKQFTEGIATTGLKG